MKKATEQFIKEIVKSLNKGSSDFIISFYTYLSQMSGRNCLNEKEKNEYYILTALFYSVKYYYKNHMQRIVYGLIYPGASTEAKGLSIVLTSEAVDNFLELDLVVMYRFIRNEDTFVHIHAQKSENLKKVNTHYPTLFEFLKTNIILLNVNQRMDKL